MKLAPILKVGLMHVHCVLLEHSVILKEQLNALCAYMVHIPMKLGQLNAVYVNSVDMRLKEHLHALFCEKGNYADQREQYVCEQCESGKYSTETCITQLYDSEFFYWELISMLKKCMHDHLDCRFPFDLCLFNASDHLCLSCSYHCGVV